MRKKEIKYLDILEVRKLGGSNLIPLTRPFKIVNIKTGDKVKVSISGKKIIIEKI